MSKVSVAEIVFDSTILAGTNKVGLIKPDRYGYYPVVLGAFNTVNRRGDFYPMSEIIRRAFQPNSELMEKINRQALRGEYEHPLPTPTMTKIQYINRLRIIHPDRCTHHIAKIWFDETNYKNPDGSPMCVIMGLVKPGGLLGHILQSAFDNPRENVAFSLRSLSKNIPLLSGRFRREVREPITYDYVLTGGVAIADKFYSPALESEFTQDTGVFTFDREEIIQAEYLERNYTHQGLHSSVSNESYGGTPLSSLLAAMGWEPKKGTDFLSW